MKRIRKLTTAFLVIALLVTSLVSAPAFAAGEPEVVRIAGDSRYLTAIEVSKKAYTSATDVVIASGENFPDALAGSVLAHQLNAPILLAKRDSIDAKTLAEIKRLGASSVTILGGDKAIGAPVVNALTQKGLTVSTIEGVNRYETAALIAEAVTGYDDTVFLATGENYADALAIGPYAAANSIPILLTTSNALHKDTAKALRALKPTKVVVLGGEKAVSPAVVRSVEELGIKKANITRIAGASRELTALAIASEYADSLSETELIAVTGDNFADAILGSYFGALAGETEGDPFPIVLVRDGVKVQVDGFIRGYLIDDEGELDLDEFEEPQASDTQFETMYIIGGPKAVSEGVALKLEEALLKFDIVLNKAYRNEFLQGQGFWADFVFDGVYDGSDIVVKVKGETLKPIQYDYYFDDLVVEDEITYGYGAFVLTLYPNILNRLGPGEHKVTLTIDGFEVEDLKIIVRDADAATLEAEVVSPDKAKVAFKANTPVVVQLEGYDPTNEVAPWLISFARAKVFVDNKEMSDYAVDSAEDTVTLDGKYVQKLPIGKHTVKVVLLDKREAEATFEVVDGSKQFVAFDAAGKKLAITRPVDSNDNQDVHVFILGYDGGPAFDKDEPLEVTFNKRKLALTSDYSVTEEGVITINAAVFAGLELGEYPITVTYDEAKLAPITVKIVAGAVNATQSVMKLATTPPVKVNSAAKVTIELKDTLGNAAMGDSVILIKATAGTFVAELGKEEEVNLALSADMAGKYKATEGIPVRIDASGKATIYFMSNLATSADVTLTACDLDGGHLAVNTVTFGVSK